MRLVEQSRGAFPTNIRQLDRLFFFFLFSSWRLIALGFIGCPLPRSIAKRRVGGVQPDAWCADSIVTSPLYNNKKKELIHNVINIWGIVSRLMDEQSRCSAALVCSSSCFSSCLFEKLIPTWRHTLFKLHLLFHTSFFAFDFIYRIQRAIKNSNSSILRC